MVLVLNPGHGQLVNDFSQEHDCRLPSVICFQISAVSFQLTAPDAVTATIATAVLFYLLKLKPSSAEING